MVGSFGNHHCAIRTALCLAAGFVLACQPALAQFTQAKTSVIAPISLNCTAASADQGKIAPQQAEILCSAAGGMGLPPNPPTALHLTVTAAYQRSARHPRAWIFANAQERASPPLNTRFFDQGAKFALHANFINVFFQTNAVPSATDISTNSLRNDQCVLSAPCATLLTL